MVHTGRLEPKPNQKWASVAMGFTEADLHLALDFNGPGLDCAWCSLSPGLDWPWAWSSLGLVFT